MDPVAPRPYEAYAVHDDERVYGFFGPYRFLSNFHAAPVMFEGVMFPSTENAYQAQKVYDVPHLFEQFTTCTPSASKKLGRANPIRPGWDSVKVDVMTALVFDKFWRHRDLRDLLLATGTRELTEANHWNDTFWGVCDGRGKNRLGRILMGVRTLLRP